MIGPPALLPGARPRPCPTACRHRTARLPRPAPAIGKYRIVSGRLGEGATSEVFLAHDPFHHRDVAIKRVRQRAGGESARGHYRSASSPPRRRWWAACTTRTWCRSTTPWPTPSALPGDGVRAGVTLRRYCRADNLLPLEQIVEIGFKCAMALGYVLPPGA
jgi:hypothetical protein